MSKKKKKSGILSDIAAPIIKSAKSRMHEFAEWQKNVEIINSEETSPELIQLPYTNFFFSEEEEYVNKAFRDYVARYNCVIAAKSHYEFLHGKIRACNNIKRKDLAVDFEQKAAEARAELDAARAKCKASFKSECSSILLKNAEIKDTFNAFACKLPKNQIPIISGFFKGTQTKAAKLGEKYALIFTPAYIMYYRGTEENIELLQYDDVSISAARHSATASVKGREYSLELGDGTSAAVFRNAFNAYSSLLESEYKDIVELLLSRDEKLFYAGSVKTYKANQRKTENTGKSQSTAAVKDSLELLPPVPKAKGTTKKPAMEKSTSDKKDDIKNLTVTEEAIVGWYGKEKNLVLPDGLAKTVGTAFRWCHSLEAIELPKGAACIADNAFEGCDSLRRVVIPSSVTDIGKEAFRGCKLLTELKLPIGIKSIPPRMLCGCTALEKLTVPAGVTKLECGAFSDCTGLKELILPKSLVSVEDGAFENCRSLEQITFPDSVVKIGKSAFSGCTALKQVRLGNGIRIIPDLCFANDTALNGVSVSPDISEIGDKAFFGCGKLQGLEDAKTGRGLAALPRLTRIGCSAFEGCSSFAGFELLSGITFIGDRAFAECTSIKGITLPESIKSLGESAFLGCSSLEHVSAAEGVDWHKKNCFNGTPWLETQSKDGFIIAEGLLEAYTGKELSVTIPEGVTAIGANAFSGNERIASVTVPEGVCVIEERAFADCERLSLIYIPASVVFIADDAFENDKYVVFKCTKGSVASAFRTRKKIPCEYVTVSERRADEKERKKAGADKVKSAEPEKIEPMEPAAVLPETIEYTEKPFDTSRVSLSLLSDSRRITNNIFSLRFSQNEAVSEDKAAAEYEVFVVDAKGQIISSVKTIRADKAGDELTHRVSLTLSKQNKLDKKAEYFVILRYKGAGTEILSKTQYKISIEFGSMFGI